MIFRRQIGWCVAEAYRLFGVRRRRLAEVLQPGVILPIVFHGAKPMEVRAIISWLKSSGCLDRIELTFDDGWREFIDTLPVLEEFEIKATLFIAPGETRRGRVWTDGTTIAQRQRLYSVSEAERVARLEAWGISVQRHLMTEFEVREVAKHPLVRIGNHTWSHLSCTDRPKAEVIAEIIKAQETIADWCGYRPTDFAYPFGRGADELDDEISKLGMTPYYTRQGLVSVETRGAARNMVYEGMFATENIGRILRAWPKVGVTL